LNVVLVSILNARYRTPETQYSFVQYSYKCEATLNSIAVFLIKGRQLNIYQQTLN